MILYNQRYNLRYNETSILPLYNHNQRLGEIHMNLFYTNRISSINIFKINYIASCLNLDGVFNHIDEPHQRQSLSTSHYNKRKSSFR
jgi:hypothetical protein